MRGNKGQAHSDRLYRAKNTYNIADGVNEFQAREYFAKIAEPETKKDIRKLSFKNYLLSKRSTLFKRDGFVQTFYR